MMYLPRICEHCLNPSCVASCPSGAMYKREEDGIVLVDQDKCRGWRMCVSGCPYKKVYFNWTVRQGREVHDLLSAHRGRPADGLLGDLRRPHPLSRPRALRRRHASRRPRRRPTRRTCSTRSSRSSSIPRTPTCAWPRARDGIPDDWIEAARRSPVYEARDPLAESRCRCTPSTARCRWSGTCRRCRRSMSTIEGANSECDPDDVFPAIDTLRIPIAYLANLLSAGDEEVIRNVLKRLAAMRRYMRELNITGEGETAVAASRRHDAARHRGHVPPAGDREVRGPLRDPARAHRARRQARRAAGVVRAGLRGRSGQLRLDRPERRLRRRGLPPHQRRRADARPRRDRGGRVQVGRRRRRRAGRGRRARTPANGSGGALDIVQVRPRERE